MPSHCVFGEGGAHGNIHDMFTYIYIFFAFVIEVPFVSRGFGRHGVFGLRPWLANTAPADVFFSTAGSKWPLELVLELQIA